MRTEIDGWVFRGRVDVDAMLVLARDKLEPFTSATGALRIPMEGHTITASKD